MYARITTFELKPGMVDEGIKMARDSILPAAREQPGFKGLWNMADRSNNKAIAITLWETEADLIACETCGYYQEQLDKGASLLVGTTGREIYEVVMEP